MERICLECHVAFTPKVEQGQKYCSRFCASRAIGKKNKGRTPGFSHSEVTKKKMSAAARDYLATEEGYNQRSESMRGRRMGESAKQHMKESALKRWSKRGDDWERQMNHLRSIQSPTHIEEILVSLVLFEFPTIVREQKFGKYRVDAYLPEYHLAFEADGVYWHKDTEADKTRDAYLLKEHSLTVVRFTERELLEIERNSRV